ncbi:MAG: peptidase M15 [Tannerellaceae bacterium]|nr:peptidase M15 [Tannerellaceae bacterium]
MITENFSWEEMQESRIARERGISNTPGTAERAAMERLVRELLQPLRDIYGQPIRITSGYRSAELNRLVGGVPDSQHTKGEAADCTIAGDIKDLYYILMESELLFDQVIVYRKRNFMHLSLRTEKENRYRVMFQ